jgi:hypothetical protein
MTRPPGCALHRIGDHLGYLFLPQASGALEEMHGSPEYESLAGVSAAEATVIAKWCGALSVPRSPDPGLPLGCHNDRHVS